MTWVHIARKDFADASRSLVLWVLTALLILLVGGLSAVPYLLDSSAATFEDALGFLFSPIALLLPIMGLIVGYQAIVGERESGSIRFLIGLPNSRRDVMIGKLVGRTGVIAIPTTIGFAIGGLIVFALYDRFVIADFLGLFVFSILMGMVYVAIAVGISGCVTSRAKAIAAVASVYIFVDIIWDFVPMAVYWVTEGSLPSFAGPFPAWFVFIERLSPSQALTAISVNLVDFVGAEDMAITAADRVQGDLPFYLADWVAWLIVIAWIAVPMAIGYYRFNHAQIS